MSTTQSPRETTGIAMLDTAAIQGPEDDIDFSDGPWLAHGVALTEDAVAYGVSAEEDVIGVYYPAETVREAEGMLEGKKLVTDTEHDDFDIAAPSIDTIVGEVVRDAYEPGVGLVFEAEIDDPDVARLVARDRVEVSPVIAREVSDEPDPEHDAHVATEIHGFRDLAVVSEGAGELASIDLGALRQALASAFDVEYNHAMQELAPEVKSCKDSVLEDNPGMDEGDAIAICRAQLSDADVPDPEVIEALMDDETDETPERISDNAPNADTLGLPMTDETPTDALESREDVAGTIGGIWGGDRLDAVVDGIFGAMDVDPDDEDRAAARSAAEGVFENGIEETLETIDNVVEDMGGYGYDGDDETDHMTDDPDGEEPAEALDETTQEELATAKRKYAELLAEEDYLVDSLVDTKTLPELVDLVESQEDVSGADALVQNPTAGDATDDDTDDAVGYDALSAEKQAEADKHLQTARVWKDRAPNTAAQSLSRYNELTGEDIELEAL